MSPTHDGQNISLLVQPRNGAEVLDDIVKGLIADETSDGRTLIGTKAHVTCAGKQPGTDVDLLFGKMASQLYHVAVQGNLVYTLTYTHAPNGKVDDSIESAFDSLCPP